MSENYNSEIFIEKLKIKDPIAIESLVKAYTSQIYNASRSLGFNSNDSDDLTQSVWLSFFDAIQNFQGKSQIRTYLFGILYNKASEHRKKNNKIDKTVEVEELLEKHFDHKGHWVTGPKDPETFLAASQTMKLIADCFSLLPLNQKMAFKLKEIEDDLTENICHILGISTTHLGVLLFRARNQLRECIERKS